MNRKHCPNCENEDTEFVQFGGADSSVVATTPEDVGDGVLELRMCNECGAGLEYVLEPTNVEVLSPIEQ